jgi:integrase
LRHTFGTELSLATGGNVATVAHMLGHAGPQMAERYRAAAVPAHLVAAAKALGKRLEVTVGSRRKRSANR